MPYIGTSPSQGVRRVHTYTASANQTSFSGAGAEGATLSYKDSNFVDVYQNGILLKPSTDYTATSGTTVVLVTGTSVNDVVEIIAYDAFSIANSYTKADSDTRYPFLGNNSIVRTNGQTISADITISSTTNGEGILREIHEQCKIIVFSNGSDIGVEADKYNFNLITAKGSLLKASMLRDFEAGKQTECDHILGYLIELAEKNNVECSLIKAAHTRIKVGL